MLKKSTPKFFLTRRETKHLVERIGQFEKTTGCELVFHFRRKFAGEPEEQNKELFFKYGLDKTTDRRAMLVTLALQDRKFAVWADEGIEKHAGRELHDEIGRHLKGYLKEGQHLKALLEVIGSAEKALKGLGSTKHGKNQISDAPILEEGE